MRKQQARIALISAGACCDIFPPIIHLSIIMAQIDSRAAGSLAKIADACQNEHHASCHAITIDDSRACTVFKSLLTEVISPAHVNWIEPLTKTFCWHSECLNSKCEQQSGIFVLSKQSAAGISTLPKHNGMEIFRSKWRKRRTLTPDFLCDVIFFDLRRAARVIVLPNALSVVISKLCFFIYRMHSGIVWCAHSP